MNIASIPKNILCYFGIYGVTKRAYQKIFKPKPKAKSKSTRGPNKKNVIPYALLTKASMNLFSSQKVDSVVYFSDGADKAYQLNQWLPVFEDLSEDISFSVLIRSYVFYEKLISSGVKLDVRYIHTIDDLISFYEKKEVKSIFLTYSNGIFHFREYIFEDPNHYNSLKLKNEKKYVIRDGAINLELIQEIANITPITAELPVPFPQADSFDKVINLCELLNENGSLTREHITINYDFDVRQTNYYTDAGRYLSLINKSRENGEINYFLTDLGKRIFTLSITERQIEFFKIILSHQVFNQVIKSYFRNYEPPNKNTIVEIMKRSNLYNISSETTFQRRASTISSWINWIIDQIEE